MNDNLYDTPLRILLLIAFGSILGSNADAQGFQQLYGTSAENSFSKVIPHGTDYYVLGQGANSRATVTRLDAAGQIQWTQSLNIASAWNDAVLTPGGDLLLAGGTLPADNTGKGLLGRISAGGTFGFLGSYDGPGRDFFTRIVHNASPQNAAFPYYVLGTQAGANLSEEDVVLMNISQSGAINWKKIIFYTGSDDEFSRDMIALPGGDLLLGGNTNGNGILIRVDNTGQTVGGAVELESATALANASGGGGNFCRRRRIARRSTPP
ncbi:MAG: hypothetical protein IPL27_01815 [Lewinellaceae bacterium]|nr:hypothetical protein [Lewinellaceae bacterium]